MAAELQVDGQGTKLHSIKQFLVRPPKNATALVLLPAPEDDSDAEPLAVWEDKEHFRPAIAVEVLQSLEAHAAETQKHLVVCKLCFMSESNAVLKQLRLYIRNENINASAMVSQPAELTGTSISLVMQAQRHTEMSMRLMADTQVKVLQQMQQVSQHACDMVSLMAQRLVDAESRGAESEARMREAQEALHRAQTAETPEEKEQGMAKFLELVGPILPQLMTRLLPAMIPPPPYTPPAT